MLKSTKWVSSDLGEEDDVQLDLLPGFRFHPTDEELITHYSSRKVLNCSFRAQAIGEVDLNKFEPWELPRRAKMGEKEWYFFCIRYRKYPTGLRTNRATEAGYWKATGKDKEIYQMKTLVGIKKTLVFYKGRAPKGLKTYWVMHEYRLDGELSQSNLRETAKFDEKEWVICRVFEKSHGGGNKTHMSMNSADLTPSILVPPLMDSSHTQKSNHATISFHHMTEPMSSVKEQDHSTLFGFESYDSLDYDESLAKMSLENCGSGLGEPLNLVEFLWK